MLLRRIKKHMNDQDWTAIAIDFLIVVSGVFLGIQLGNWNDERMDRLDEDKYLSRLVEDLELTKELLESDLDWQVSNAGHLEPVLNSLRRCKLESADRDRFALGLFVAGKFNSQFFIDKTLEELRSSGRLNVIQKEEIRRDLIDLDRSFRVNSSQMDMIEQWAVEPLNGIQGKTVFINLDEGSKSRSDLGWEDIEFDFSAACRDKSFVGEISALRSYAIENAGRDRDLLGETNQLLQKIEASK